MKTPKKISLPVLPESYFGRLQVTKHVDGCIVIVIIQDKKEDSLLNPGTKDIVGEVVAEIGLTQENSKKLIDFMV